MACPTHAAKQAITRTHACQSTAERRASAGDAPRGERGVGPVLPHLLQLLLATVLLQRAVEPLDLGLPPRQLLPQLLVLPGQVVPLSLQPPVVTLRAGRGQAKTYDWVRVAW